MFESKKVPEVDLSFIKPFSPSILICDESQKMTKMVLEVIYINGFRFHSKKNLFPQRDF